MKWRVKKLRKAGVPNELIDSKVELRLYLQFGKRVIFEEVERKREKKAAEQRRIMDEARETENRLKEVSSELDEKSEVDTFNRVKTEAVKPLVETAPPRAFPVVGESLLIYDRGRSPTHSMDEDMGLSEIQMNDTGMHQENKLKELDELILKKIAKDKRKHWFF